MALNPAFDSVSTRKLPFACGYVYGQGDNVLSTTAVDGSQIILNLLGEGEWDGPALSNSFTQVAGTSTPAIPPHLVRQFAAAAPGTWLTSLISLMHFHSGSFSTKGGANNAMTSQGSAQWADQNYDEWFADFPIFTPPQCFSGIAYAVWRAPLATGLNLKEGWGQMTVSGAAVWRSTRCRIFDAYGNVTAYQFTCNPAWHKVEAILRYKIRPQMPGLAGLTAAEKACFNWESIAELAARNDYILPNGNPRYLGNYIWAADATLTSILELMQRVDQSFIREQNGQIYMIGNDSRTAVFQCSANHVVPGSVKLQKKDISKAPNVFVPQFRDLGIPAVSQVVSTASTTALETVSFGVNEFEPALQFNTTSPDPFVPFGVFTYGGGTPSTMDGDYNAGNFVPTTTGPDLGAFITPAGPLLGDVVLGLYPGTPAALPTGGYIGSNDARFSQRAPTTVQHRSAQRMTRMSAPGLAVQPNIRPVRYDCGASTYDQTNRIMKFERDSSLGTDIGAGWTAPITGTLTFYLESVDVNNVPLLQAGVHDVIHLDDWVYPEKPGDYEIMEMPEILAPAGDSLGAITLVLRQYNPAASTDVSDPPGDSYQNVPNDGLQLSGFAALVNPAWVMQATPIATLAGDGSLTITMPDLSVQVMGQPIPTAYPAASWAEITPGSPVLLYVTDASGVGTSPTFTMVPGTTPVSSPAAGEMLLFAGTFGMFLGVYNSGTSYSVGQVVSYNGWSYGSLVNANVGNEPDTSPTQWGVLGAAGTLSYSGSGPAPAVYAPRFPLVV